MGVASDAISRAILVGAYRSGAITPEQFGDIVDQLFQEAQWISPNAPGSAEKVLRFITDLHHQLGLDQPKLPEKRPA